MAQKVITVTGFAPVNVQLQEIDFPKVTAALVAGYTVKEIKQITVNLANTSYIIVFVLEKV